MRFQSIPSRSSLGRSARYTVLNSSPLSERVRRRVSPSCPHTAGLLAPRRGLGRPGGHAGSPGHAAPWRPTSATPGQHDGEDRADPGAGPTQGHADPGATRRHARPARARPARRVRRRGPRRPGATRHSGGQLVEHGQAGPGPRGIQGHAAPRPRLASTSARTRPTRSHADPGPRGTAAGQAGPGPRRPWPPARRPRSGLALAELGRARQAWPCIRVVSVVSRTTRTCGARHGRRAVR
jgi:hypothetical protein